MTNLEANLAELVSVNNHAAVEDEGGLRHVVVHRLPADLAELFPLGRNHDGFLLLARLERRRRKSDLLLDCTKIKFTSQRETDENTKRKDALCSRVMLGHASARSIQICSASTFGS